MVESNVGAKSGMEILSKTDAVLHALTEHPELSAAALAEHVDQPVSSTYRLVTNLVALGWVESGSKRGLFRLGLDVMRIGGLLEDRVDVREAALPTLRSLLADTGATSFLCLRRGDQAVCVERLEGRDVLSLALALGDSLPLYQGAAPQALLSFLPRSERSRLLEDYEHRRAADPSIPSPSELEKTIERTRDQGYAVSDGDVTPGIAALGAPVFNHRGELEAAISISGLRTQILDTGVPTIQLVQEAAASVSRALGYLESSVAREAS